MLADSARRLVLGGADVIAIGAFDHGTQSLFGHGAGTRPILAHMTAPVLFSH